MADLSAGRIPLRPLMNDAVLQAVQQHASTRLLLDGRSRPTTNLYLHHEVLPAAFEIDAGPSRVIRTMADSVLVFADDQPTANWGHPCRYLLYSADQGTLLSEVPGRFAPRLQDSPAFRMLVQSVSFPPSLAHPGPARLAQLVANGATFAGNGVGKRHALLYAGNSNNRHVNDLEFLYRTLVDLYGFDPADIQILNYDGTVNYQKASAPLHWPGDNSAYRIKVNGPGTGDALLAAMDTLKAKLRPDDFLLIHTNNHGDYDADHGIASLCTLDLKTMTWGPSLKATDFAAKLKGFPPFATLVVMMEQCHSGGFNQPVIDASPARQTSIASAVPPADSSAGGDNYDPFALSWISALVGVGPDGSALPIKPDADGNGIISVGEAFGYSAQPSVHDAMDTPVYNEAPAGIGKTLALGWMEQPRIRTVPGSPIIGVHRGPAKLEAFAVTDAGKLVFAAWDQNVDAGRWRGWFPLQGATAVPGSLVHAVSRDPGKLDAFVCGTDGHPYTAAWDEQVDHFVGAWRGWWPIANTLLKPGSPIDAVARSPHQLDAFAVGADGAIRTAAWDQNVAQGQWRGWWDMAGGRTVPGGTVTAVARAPDKLDAFVVGTDGAVYTAAWDQTVSQGAWRGWWAIPGLKAVPGTRVSAAARSTSQLDLVVADAGGAIMTAAWDQNVSAGAWRGWWPVAGGRTAAGGAVTMVARSGHQLDVFTVGTDGATYTAAWDQNIGAGQWRGWWPVVSGRSRLGTLIGVASRDPNKLDLWVGGTDGAPWTAAWDQNVASGAWRGWWPVPN